MKRHIFFKTIVAIAFFAIAMLGCTKNPLSNNYEKPTLKAAYKDVSYTTVKLTCDISKNNFTECGFWYGTKSDLSDKKTVNASLSSNKQYAAVVLSNLESYKIYYFQAYASNGKNVAISDLQIFYTIPVSAHPEAVDLGLSVKWASCNVGASSPSDYGSYFAWGETSPKSDYSWLTYLFRASGDSWYNNVTFSKYNTSDLERILDLSDDAARVNWGGSWRMPTVSDFSELLSYCTWTLTTMEGKNGYVMTSKMNGNSIFLPVAGGYNGTYLKDGCVYYWSSCLPSLGTQGFPKDAYYLGGNSGRLIVIGDGDRYEGGSVRPVTE